MLIIIKFWFILFVLWDIDWNLVKSSNVRGGSFFKILIKVNELWKTFPISTIEIKFIRNRNQRLYNPHINIYMLLKFRMRIFRKFAGKWSINFIWISKHNTHKRFPLETREATIRSLIWDKKVRLLNTSKIW